MVLRDLCDASDLAGQKNDQMQWLGELLSQAKRIGNNYYQSVALMMMGKRLYYECTSFLTPCAQGCQPPNHSLK